MRVTPRVGVHPIGRAKPPVLTLGGIRNGSFIEDLSRALALGLSRRYLLRSFAAAMAAVTAGGLLRHAIPQAWAQSSKCQLFPMDQAIHDAEVARLNTFWFTCFAPGVVATLALLASPVPPSAIVPIVYFLICVKKNNIDTEETIRKARDAECRKLNQAGQCTHPEGITTTDGVCCDPSRPVGCRGTRNGATTDTCCFEGETCCPDATCCQKDRVCKFDGVSWRCVNP